MFKNTPQILIKTYGLQLRQKFKNAVTVAQQARLKIDDDIPNEAIGLKAISEGYNLAKLVSLGKLKVLCYAQSKDQVTIHIANFQNDTLRAKLEPGQFLAAKKNSNQYLVTRKSYEWQIPLGQCVKTCQTFCFDGQFDAPSKDDEYLIGTIKSGFYQQGMDQYQVWEIIVKMQSKADDFKFKQEQQANIIAIKKGDLKMMMKKWESELDQW